MRKKMFAGALPQVFENAKELRKKMTDAENLLWVYLKQKPLGFKFRRQHPIWMYVADFYCHQKKLVIEVDGSIHTLQEVQENDLCKDEYFISEGLTVLRFSNQEVMEDVLLVLQKIKNYLQTPDLSSRPGG